MRRSWKLMRKDWRLNRAVASGLFIMTAFVYAFWGATYLWDQYRYYSAPITTLSSHRGPLLMTAQMGAPLSDYMRSAAEMGLLFIVLAAAVFGGAAFANERREKSADFLAMLPVKRGEIIISKLMVCAGVLAFALAIEMGVLLCTNFVRSAAIFNFAATALAVFGIGWLLSTFLSSTAIAASVAILLACFMSLFFAIMSPHFMTSLMSSALELSVAAVFILTANLYYLKRVKP